jgi:hypothetical protein
MGVKKALRPRSYEEIGKALSNEGDLNEPIVIEIPINGQTS